MTRILMIRTSALGDVVQAMPVLQALRRHRPAARIGWLIEESFAPLVQGHPDLDTVIVVRLRQWRRSPFSHRTLRQIGAFLAALDDFAPEVVLDLMGNHKAGILAALTLCDRRIGLVSNLRREPSSRIWLSETVDSRRRHSVDKMLSVLDALGIPPEPADFGGDRIPGATAPNAPEPGIPAPKVLIHPGAGWDNKRYPAARWGEVAWRLREASGTTIGVIVGLEERPLADAIVGASRGAAAAVEAPELLQLRRLLAQADLVLGGDTGPVHLAHALGRPVLCLMGPTDPACCGPYGAPERALWRQLPCSFCHKRYPQTMPCLEQIDPTVIVDRALRLLQNLPLPRSGPLEEGEAGCIVVH